jgi:hypothetical protein
MEKEVPIPHVNCLAIMSGPTPCLVPTIWESRGMKMSSLSLVDNQQSSTDTGGQGEEMVETKNSNKKNYWKT